MKTIFLYVSPIVTGATIGFLSAKAGISLWLMCALVIINVVFINLAKHD